MTERVWRHRFVQALFEILRKTTGLGADKCYDLAFDDVDSYWREWNVFDSPEDAAQTAYKRMKEPG